MSDVAAPAIGYPPLPGYRLAEIRAAVCRHFDLTEEEMKSPARTRRITQPRQVGMYLARRLTIQSTPQVARAFNKKDHTTVLHAVKHITDLRRRDAEVEHAIRAIVADLKGAAQ